MTENDSQDIKTLVSKLNDRSIQSKRESGFTRYVLYGILGYLSLSLIRGSAILNINEYDASVFNTILAAYFLTLSIYRIFSIYRKGVNSETEPLITINDKIDYTPHLKNYSTVYIIFPAIFSLVTFLVYGNIGNITLFIILTITLLLWIINTMYYRSTSEIKIKPTQKFPFTWYRSRPEIFLMPIYTILSCGLLYLHHKELTHNLFVSALIFGGQVKILLVVVEHLIDYEKDDTISRFLKKLEVGLFTGRTSTAEAKSQLSRNFIGIPLDEFLTNLKDEIGMFVDTKIDESNKIIKELNAMGQPKSSKLNQLVTTLVSNMETHERQTRAVIEKKEEVSSTLKGLIIKLQLSKRMDEVIIVEEWVNNANIELSRFDMVSKNLMSTCKIKLDELKKMQQSTE